MGFRSVIPIKDERDNLVPLTEQLVKVLDGREESRSPPFELIFIDDGSSDGSSDVLDGLAAQYRTVKVFHFDRNYGQSAAFDAGFKQSTGELVMTIDGDLQNDPADIATLLPHIQTFDLVCGWRKDRHDNLTRKISTRIANKVRSAVTGGTIPWLAPGRAGDAARERALASQQATAMPVRIRAPSR